MPVTNIQAFSCVALHHIRQLKEAIYNSEDPTLSDILTFMEGRLGVGTDLPYPCPKCQGQGQYIPSTDGITLPTTTPIGDVPITVKDLIGVTLTANITCSICAGEGYTAVQVQTITGPTTYQNAP